MTPTSPVSYNLITATTSCLKRYVTFSGRACRSEYWYWVLATFIAGILTACADIAFVGMEGVMNDNTPISDIFNLLIMLPGLAVFVRRLHDTGRSAWNLLWLLLPIIGWIITLVYCCQDSREANKYGEGPAAPIA